MSEQNTDYQEWLRTNLDQAGRGSRRRLAEYLHLSPDAITRMLNKDPGKETRDIRANELDRIREFFGQQPGIKPAAPGDTVSGPYPVPTGTVTFGGDVQAGDFRPVNEGFDQDQGDHMVPAIIFPHPDYPNVRQCAWRVHGDSMDQAGIREGMWVVGGMYGDYVDKVGELRNGQYVVVERTRYGGSERELTVKEVQFARSGMHLVPRSTNERHKEFVVPLNEDEADGDAETISVVAVVFMAVNDFTAQKL